MMTWLVSISISILCLTSHLVAVKFLGEKLPTSFATPAFYTFAILALYLVFFIERPQVNLSEVFVPSILILLFVAGVTIGFTDFFFVKSINLGGQVSTIMPMLVGGVTLLIAIIGFFLFKENMSLYKVIGITMTVAGILLINKG